MRDARRIGPILGLVEHVWRNHPDWRLSQVLVNALGVTAPEVFYREDDELARGLHELMERRDGIFQSGGESNDG